MKRGKRGGGSKTGWEAFGQKREYKDHVLQKSEKEGAFHQKCRTEVSAGTINLVEFIIGGIRRINLRKEGVIGWERGTSDFLIGGQRGRGGVWQSRSEL